MIIRVKDGKTIVNEPCGECHLQAGEVCDICGASRPPADNPLFEGMTMMSHIITTAKVFGAIALVIGVGFLILVPIFYCIAKGNQ